MPDVRLHLSAAALLVRIWIILLLFFAHIPFNLANAEFAEIKEPEEMHMLAKGSFEVTLTPQLEDDIDAGRLLIEKQYQGELLGEGKGQMLSKRTEIDGSAGYVAIEQFNGEIGVLQGSFTLIHRGLMDQGSQSLEVIVIPDSGTGDFEGISGNMHIDIADGQHNYRFEYQIDANK